MENVKKIIGMNAVRIALNDGKHLKGTGILYVSQAEKRAMVFTAAHVVKPIFKVAQSIELYLTCTDNDNRYRVIRVNTQLIENNQKAGAEVYPVYIHQEYDHEKLLNDAAIICIPYEEWMYSFKGINIESVEGVKKQVGWGFPGSTNNEWEKDSELELAGKTMISGCVGVQQSKRYSLTYDINIIGNKIKRQDIMEGFSGSGLFEIREHGLTLVGIVSKGYGEETAGTKLWASSAELILDILAENNIEIGLPRTFDNFIQPVVNSILKRRIGARRYFCDAAEYLICDEKLLPETLIHESSDFYEKLYCEGKRKGCPFYWEGQLKKAVYLCGSVETKDMAHPVLQMPEPFSSDMVQIEFICTEECADDMICQLIQHDYFSESGKLNDGTIIIVNGKKGLESLNELISRGECRNIIVNISDDYVSSHEFNNKLSNLIVNKPEKGFSITRGDVSECNLAVVGIDTLMKPIIQGSGEKEKVRNEIEGELRKIWEL